uniref:Uncharacterized protein n=1 Tax=Cacopsylla melanoneura TaxID=428564 RepID=A0A8D9FCD1_9HEMI
MNKFAILCLFGCFSLAVVSAQKDETTPIPEINLLDEILRQITNGLLNSRNNGANGLYEVTDDGSIRFVPKKVEESSPAESVVSSTESSPSTTTSPTPVVSSTTPEPNLSNDESTKDYVDSEEDAEGTMWEFVSHRGEGQDPLGESEEFPLVDTNEIENDVRVKPSKMDTLERRRRDVKVDVGGSSGSGSDSGVNVDVKKPGNNVNVNVGIQDFLSALGIHFNAKPSSGGASSSYASGNGGVNVNVDKPGHNVDVNVGGKPSGSGSNVDVNVNKPNKQTNVAVDWASFIPFVNVGVNKNKGGNGNVDVNVGGNGKSSGFVDVKVNKGEEGNHLEEGHASGRKNVVVRAPFVDVNVDGEFNHPPPPAFGDEEHPHPPKKHRKHHRREHADRDRNVSVNVGGQGGGPFVDVKVGGEGKTAQGKAVGRKCVKINVPFVNVLINRNCDPEA